MTDTDFTTNTTHLLWLGNEQRWCEIRIERNGDYTFKNGRDAAAWLLDGREDK